MLGTAQTVEPECFGKEGHETRAEALKLVSRIKSRNRYRNSSLNIYRCDHCHKWHVGSHLKRGS